LVLVALVLAKLTEHRVHLLYSVLLRQLVVDMVLAAVSAALLEVLVVLVAEDKVIVPQLQVEPEIHHQPVQAKGVMVVMDMHQQSHCQLLLEAVEVHQR
jgi:hypothetical protein